MIQVAIVDDQISDANRIKQYFERYQEETQESIKLTVFTDGDQLVSNYHSQFDMIFMDIEMKFMNGMSAAEEIRKTDSKVIIVFVTNMHQYAIKGYRVDAFDYLVKPVGYFAFSQCVGRAIARMKNRASKNLILKIKGGTVRLDAMDLLYIESSGHNVTFYTAGGDYESGTTMKQVEELLNGLNFFRASKWCIINLAHVDSFQNGCVKLMGKEIHIARAREKSFLEALTAYWGEVFR